MFAATRWLVAAGVILMDARCLMADAMNAPAARAECQAALAATNSPISPRSCAHLRLARIFAAEGNAAAARAEYSAIAANPAYPEVHRAEAAECVLELDRIGRGLPPRDPAASRTVPPPVNNFAAEIWVAPEGSDRNHGLAAAPVAGLTRARDLVRLIRKRGERRAIAVNLRPGEYAVTNSLQLTAEDSGTEMGPTVYRAVEPGKTILYGGQRLKGFGAVTDPAILNRLPEGARGKVQACDLRAQGIVEYGRLAVRGFGHGSPPPTVELFVNGKPMTLARWPNSGFTDIRRVVSGGDKSAGKPTVFEYADDRHARWTQAGDVWLFGYFRWLWADSTLAVSRVDPQARTLVCDEPYRWSPNEPPPGATMGHYYALNLLEEIDQPGEWYLDRAAGTLYLYPPAELAGAKVEFGMLAAPMVTMTNVADVRFEGLAFDLGRYNGLALTECRRVLLAGCAVSRFAGNGIMIHGGEADGILSCDIHTIGRRATEVIGGNRATLKPGHHFVENCRIHDFGRTDRGSSAPGSALTD